MRPPPGDRVTGSIPVVPARTWRSSRAPEYTLNVDQTDLAASGVELSIGDPYDGVTVLLNRTQIDELITDLVERRALLVSRRAGSERFDR